MATTDSVFQGQIAALYIWKECLDSATISALYKLGPSYKVQVIDNSDRHCMMVMNVHAARNKISTAGSAIVV